ncbi:rod shape-determining protein MreC [Thiopseudomonas alkaliphila]|uniref:rod shape-determining protein MreC n=1 Tax=Thiopseudomonas alkaliphila TaxID=1697053 RepID=UPI0009BA717C|nr:rod shape-determining protein MreC [Thiopseudomonas alkaliphila]
MQHLFKKRPSLGTRFSVLAVLSILIIAADARFKVLTPVRNSLGVVLTPLYQVAEWPLQVWHDLDQRFSSRRQLLEENQQLKAEALQMQRRLLKQANIIEQNVRLRELLNSSALIDEKVVVTELIGEDPNPYAQRILINKGSREGVFLGQPVLDATGLMGQVVEVMPYSSRVLLITDAAHSTPVQVNRNGLRAIASGVGQSDLLELRYVAETADIKEGDLLVTSGMGQRFPAGYPVAVVTQVNRDAGQPFAVIKAVPTAALKRSRYLLLVFNNEVGYSASFVGPLPLEAEPKPAKSTEELVNAP